MTWHKKKYTANPDIKFGRVVGKIIEIVPDGNDAGNIPDFYGAANAKNPSPPENLGEDLKS